MQILLNSDSHTDGRHTMADHVEAVVHDVLDRFGEQVVRVDAHLAEAGTHHAANANEVQCNLEARLVGLEPVVVTDTAATAHQAIRGAAGKLQRAVATTLAKHDSRRHAIAVKALKLDTEDDAAT